MEEPSIVGATASKILASLGASTETLQSIKFGRGTVGKIATIAVAAILGVSVFATRVTASGALIAIGAIALIVIAVLASILFIAIKRPEIAVLEGTELVLYKHVTLGARGITPGKALPVPDPAAGKHNTLEGHGPQS